MHRLIRISLVVVGLAALAVSAFAQRTPQRCSNHLIVGTYGFTCTGFVAPAAPPGSADPVVANIPIALIGVVFSDGTGRFVGPATGNFNGLSSGEYLTTEAGGGVRSHVNSNCTGTITYQMYSGDPNSGDVTDLGKLPIDFVILDDGNQIAGMPTAPGYVVTCHLTRVHPIDW